MSKRGQEQTVLQVSQGLWERDSSRTGDAVISCRQGERRGTKCPVPFGDGKSPRHAFRSTTAHMTRACPVKEFHFVISRYDGWWAERTKGGASDDVWGVAKNRLSNFSPQKARARGIAGTANHASSASPPSIWNFWRPAPVSVWRATLFSCEPTFFCIFSISASASSVSSAAKSRTKRRPSK